DDPAERLAALLFDLEADELEGVVLALAGRRQGVPLDGEVGAAGHRAVEPDHRPAARTLRSLDPSLLAVHMKDGADLEPLRIVAGPLDEEGAVEPVRPAHPANRYVLSRRSRQERDSSSAPRWHGRSCAAPARSGPGGRSPCRRRPWPRATAGR